MILHAAGRTGEARAQAELIRAQRPDSELLCRVYAELGEREQANRIASLVDATPQLSAMRFARLFSLAGGMPFDPAATPRLAARLQAAGLKVRPYRTLAERSAGQR